MDCTSRLEKVGKPGGRLKVERRFDVALCGYYGFGNLGDELLAEALVGLLVSSGLKRERITVLSADPEATASKLGVVASNRWKPLHVWRTLRRSRSLLLGGGGLLQDPTSARSCLYYAGVVEMARAAGCVPWAFGQSVGPLRSITGRVAARRALSSCRVRCLRDEPSMEYVKQWGIEASLAPDPVLGLEYGENYGLTPQNENIILVNIRPWPDATPRVFAAQIAKLARDRGAAVRGLALSEGDRAVMKQFHDSGLLPLDELTVARSMRDISSAWPRRCLAAGMRLHFCVLSVLCGTGCVAVPYDPKVSAFAKEWGLPVWEDGGVLPETVNLLNKGISLDGARRDIRSAMKEALDHVLGEGFGEDRRNP